MIGVDIIRLSRMAAILERSGAAFVRRVFSPEEQRAAAQSDSPVHFYASAFAAKEAVFKALNLGWEEDADFREIVVGREDFGAPEITLRGRIQKRAGEKDIAGLVVSISYETDLAVAVVMALFPVSSTVSDGTGGD